MSLGHVLTNDVSNIVSHEMDDLSRVFCKTSIRRTLPTCEHQPLLACGSDLSIFKCTSLCGGTMACCQNNCKSRCFECQQLNGREARAPDDDDDDAEPVIQVQRAAHKVHRCKRSLDCCGHQCSTNCSAEHIESGCIVPCEEKCRQRCIHSVCRLKCSDPCAPCKERCTW